MTPPPPRSTLFPYTTLFRSSTGASLTRKRNEVGPGLVGPCRHVPPYPLPGASSSWVAASSLRVQLQRKVRPRSEEHTSELQSQSNLVCRLLLEKKNNRTRNE